MFLNTECQTVIHILVVLELSLVLLDLLPHLTSSTATAENPTILQRNLSFGLTKLLRGTLSVVHGELNTFLGGMGSTTLFQQEFFRICSFRNVQFLFVFFSKRGFCGNRPWDTGGSHELWSATCGTGYIRGRGETSDRWVVTRFLLAKWADSVQHYIQLLTSVGEPPWDKKTTHIELNEV